MGYVWLTISTLLTYVILLALVRWIGSTQLSQITFFNWVAGASMGNVAANMISADNRQDWFRACFALTVFTAATVVAATLALRSRKLRGVANGSPTILIYKGIIQRENLRKTKVNIDVLLMLLRQQGCFSPKEVEVAILESTGALSVLPITEAQTVNKGDIAHGPKLSDDTQAPYYEIIIDGEVDYGALADVGYDRGWLLHQLAKLNVESPKQVTLLAVNRSGNVIADTHRLEKHPSGN